MLSPDFPACTAYNFTPHGVLLYAVMHVVGVFIWLASAEEKHTERALHRTCNSFFNRNFVTEPNSRQASKTTLDDRSRCVKESSTGSMSDVRTTNRALQRFGIVRKSKSALAAFRYAYVREKNDARVSSSREGTEKTAAGVRGWSSCPRPERMLPEIRRTAQVLEGAIPLAFSTLTFLFLVTVTVMNESVGHLYLPGHLFLSPLLNGKYSLMTSLHWSSTHLQRKDGRQT